MKRVADIAPDGRRGAPKGGPTCTERVKHTRPSPWFVEACSSLDEPTLPETDNPRGVRFDLAHNTVGQRYVSGSRAALDYQPATLYSNPARARAVERARSARLAPRALARAKSDK